MAQKIKVRPSEFFSEKFRRVRVYISGLVQGVFFRDSTREKAQQLGVKGWVKNLTDGRVEIMVEGEKEKVEELVEWSRKGPLIARVDGIEIKEEEYKGKFDSFEIRY